MALVELENRFWNRERREEEEERLEEEKLAEFRRAKLTVSNSVSDQSDQQHDRFPSLSKISSPEEAPSTVMVTYKRKRQSMGYTTADKKRRVTTHLPSKSISAELNISSCWRRMKREKRRSSYRLVSNNKL